MRRFLRAYLGASVLATATTLVIQSIWVAMAGLAPAAFHDLGPTALIYAIYSLGFTLVLGLGGWAILRLANVSGYLSYAVVGAALGGLTAGLWMTPGFPRDNIFIYAWSLAGAIAAVSFRRLYYGSQASSGKTVAAAV